MPLPKREPRSRWAYVTLVVFLVALVAVVASFVMDPTGDKDEPHRPPHVSPSATK